MTESSRRVERVERVESTQFNPVSGVEKVESPLGLNLSTLTHPPAGEYRNALQTGAIVTCERCRNFSPRPNERPDGACKVHGEIWARVPFDCREYVGRKSGSRP